MIQTIAHILSRGACLLPETIGRCLAASVGLTASRIFRGERRFLYETIDRVYHRLGKQPPMKIDEIIDRLFLHFSLNVLEILRLPIVSESHLRRTFTFEGVEHLDRALARKKGVVLVVPHLGSWELLGAAIAYRGYPLHSFYLAQKENDVGSLLDRFRSYSRIVLHDRDRGGIGALKALKSGEALGMIADQDGGNQAIYADFLGHWVSVPAGPANWTLKTGAALIPLYCIRQGWSPKYVARFFPPLPDEPSGTHEQKLIARTNRLIPWMEEIILRYPHQYLWFYDRFKPRHEGHLAKLKLGGCKMQHQNPIYGALP